MGDCCGGCGLYASTQAIERRLGDLAWAAYRLGDDVQRGLVDVAFDVATLSFRRAAGRAADWAARVEQGARMLGSPRGVELVAEQARNNLEVYTLVKDVRSRLQFDSADDADLVALVQRAYDLGAYADLWAIEGLGHDYTLLRLDRDGQASGILHQGAAAALPPSALTMMHAGLGLAFAERLLPQLAPCDPPARFREVLGRFVAACEANGRPGYRGASYESLGLVARTWHPQLVPGIDAALADSDAGLAAYFWHGAGRALYFLPAYIVPVLSPWAAVERDAPHALARDNLTAGLTWAWTLVNIRQPQILAELLRAQGERLQRSPAFANGLASALIVAVDITPEDPHVAAFTAWQPQDAALADIWRRVVAPVAREALATYAPLLRRYEQLDQVFRCTDLGALANRLAATV